VVHDLKSDAKILSVFTDSQDALTFMNSKVDENEDWNNEKYFKVGPKENQSWK
jgi:hypothetical protein